jgi:catechol 2,3-dioxygenase-like lactoylglutathione lyase family enzyme
VRVGRLDHLVLTVASIEATVTFYTQILGMDVVTFGPGRTALTFGTSKINLHQAGQEFEPKALRPTPGSADICLIVDDDIADVIAQLAERESVSKRARLNAPERPGPSSAATCAIRTTISSNSATTYPDHPQGPAPEYTIDRPGS